MEPVTRLIDSFGVEDMKQAEKETIEIFCRELGLALTRITGYKIEIHPQSLPIESKNTGKDSNNRKRNKNSEHLPNKQKS